MGGFRLAWCLVGTEEICPLGPRALALPYCASWHAMGSGKCWLREAHCPLHSLKLSFDSPLDRCENRLESKQLGDFFRL